MVDKRVLWRRFLFICLLLLLGGGASIFVPASFSMAAQPPLKIMTAQPPLEIMAAQSPLKIMTAQPPFRLIAYNVENLFDLTRNGTEYSAYIPHTDAGWDAAMMRVKLTHIASVIAGAKAQIAVLSEVETPDALDRLQGVLKERGHPMGHGAISQHPTTVRCAVISSFPVVSVHEVMTGASRRSILRVTLDISGMPLMVYANHWKSRQGPESQRLPYAKALAADIATLPPHTDYILAGDFNSDYNEWQRFYDDPRMNDTRGRTGINHLLVTLYENAMTTEEGLIKGQGTHYNLWMERSPGERWSHIFFGRRGSLDHILLPGALYDAKGISYVDGSFGRYAPESLFHEGKIYRWQRAKKGRGRHLGAGYSDHLPIYADFTVAPFTASIGSGVESQDSDPPPADVRISDLYNLPVGPANYRITGVVVVYKAGSHAVVKAPQGRAIHLYTVGGSLEPGWVVDVTVKRLHDYHGLREVTAVGNVVKRGETDPDAHYLGVDRSLDLRDSHRISEVVARVCGLYRGGWLWYGDGRSVRVYTAKGIKRLKDDTRICLTKVRIGFHKRPELVVDSPHQIKVFE